MRLKFKVKPAYDGFFTDNAGGGVDSKVISSLTNSNSDLFGTFAADKAWIVEGTISDAYASFTFTAPIVGPEEVVQCRTPKGTGFGKVWERGSIDAKGDIYSHNELVQVGRLTQIDGKSIKMTGSANELMKTGMFYSHGMSDLPSNLTGSQLYGYIQVNTHPSDENYVMQTYTPYDSNVIYMRRKTNYGWQKWVRFTPSDVPISGVWENATYLNGWRNYSNDYHPVQFKVNSDGSIELRGSCKGGNATQWKEVLKINLPTKLEKTTFIRGMTKDYNLCTLTVYEDGRIVVVKDVNSDWLCLDGITITN